MFLLLILAALIAGGIAGPAVLFTVYFVMTLEKALGLAPDTGRLVAASAVCLSIPFAAYLAGMILDRFSHSQVRGRHFGLFALVLAFAAGLSHQSLFGYLETIVRIGSAQSGVLDYVLLFMKLCGGVLLNASIIAFVLIMAALIAELPVWWFSGATGFRETFRHSLVAMRAVIVISLFGLAYNLILSFVAEEFWPSVITG